MRLSHIVLFTVLVALIAMRIVELRIASRRIRASGLNPASETVFPFMVALHTSVFVLVPLEVFGLHRPFSPAVFAAAIGVLLVGTAIRFSVLSTMRECWNVRIVTPPRVVSTGLYSRIRHPNYLAVILELPAIAMIHGAWISAVAISLLNFVVLFFRIRAEERELARLPGYEDTVGHLPRFVPVPGRRARS